MHARLKAALGRSPTFQERSRNSRARPSSFAVAAATPRRSSSYGSSDFSVRTRMSWISAGLLPSGGFFVLVEVVTAMPPAGAGVAAGFFEAWANAGVARGTKTTRAAEAAQETFFI